MGKKVQKTDDNPLLIPFGRAVRVGNFKLWRSRTSVGSGKDRTGIETVNVSNLDGTWKVQIPSTMAVFSTIIQSYATVDEKMRENFLGMIFSNMYGITTTASEALHDGYFFLSEMMSFPYLLLPEKEMKERMEKGMKALGFDKAKRKEHIGKMCEYRSQLYELIEQKKTRLIDEYERQQAERRSNEEDALKQAEQDEIAEQAMEVLSDSDS